MEGAAFVTGIMLTTLVVCMIGGAWDFQPRADVASQHCQAQQLEYTKTLPSGEIECVKVTREVVK